MKVKADLSVSSACVDPDSPDEDGDIARLEGMEAGSPHHTSRPVVAPVQSPSTSTTVRRSITSDEDVAGEV